MSPKSEDALAKLHPRPIGFALFCTAVIACAFALNPDPSGHGTHTQLGLGACPFYTQFDMPCPACGMTTSVTHWFHGDLVTSALTHPLGALFALCISVGFLWGWKEVVWPRGGWPRLLSALRLRWRLMTVASCLAVLASWAYTLSTHGAL